MIGRNGPMSPLDRALIGLSGLALAILSVGVIAWAGPIVRWIARI